jgi:hypothetical protein
MPFQEARRQRIHSVWQVDVELLPGIISLRAMLETGA